MTIHTFSDPAERATALAFLALAFGVETFGARAEPARPPLVATPAAAELRIVSTEFGFSPPSPQVVAGRRVTVILDNSKGETEHLVLVRELGLRMFARANEIVRREYVFDRPGTYDFVCDLPGHTEAGMKGKLIVAPDESRTSSLSKSQSD